MRKLTALVQALAIVLVVFAATVVRAQDDPTSAIDKARAELDRIEQRLQDPNIADADLAQLRTRLEPMTADLEAAMAALQPQLAAANARLDQIGAKPKEGEPAESAEVTQERDTQAAARQKVDESIKRGGLLKVEAAQVADQITQRRRALLAERLFVPSRSVLAPSLWVDVVQEAPRDVGGVQTLFNDFKSRISNNFETADLATMGLAVAAALFLLFPARKWAAEFGERLVARQSPKSRLRRSATALFRLVATTLAPLLAALGLYLALKNVGWLPPRLEGLAATLVRASGFLGFAHGMMKALLAPGRPSWRLVELSDGAVDQIKNQPLIVASVFVAGRVVEQFNQAIVASLSASIAAAGVFALLNAGTFALAIRRLRAAQILERHDAAQPTSSVEDGGVNPLLFVYRFAILIAIAIVLVAVVVGYVPLAQFLANQVIWVTAVLWLTYLLARVIDDFFTTALSSESKFGRSFSEGLGVRTETLEQVGVLISGLIRLVICVIAVLMVSAPWGIGSTDLFGWLRMPVTGIDFGGISISFTGILTAIGLALTGFALTRGAQRWLDKDLLPKTRMDDGLKTSVSTGVGYLGTIVVVMLALAYLGFSLDRLAIVAGALSVGIGFGLQAVISNFVCGIILLAERPIKSGDWVVIGSDQGNVRRISVRSTEIELFDRSTLIVPNSDFITKSVKNVTHGAPNGRVQIVLPVSSAVDPAEVKRIAIATAKAHSTVLAFPEPQLFFTELGKADNIFTLFCNVPSPRQAASVKSDLNFALTKAFADAGVALGGPAAPDMALAVDRVAEALGGLDFARALVRAPHDASDAPGAGDEPRPAR